jgi:hypothetical protein
VVSFTPRPIYPRGKSRARNTDCIGGWVGSKPVWFALDDVERRKILPLPGHHLRPLDRPAGMAQSLYRLRHAGSLLVPSQNVWLALTNFPSNLGHRLCSCFCCRYLRNLQWPLGTRSCSDSRFLNSPVSHS